MKNGLVVLVFLLLCSWEQLPRAGEIQNGREASTKSMLIGSDYTVEELEIPRMSDSISAIWILEKIGVNLDGVGWSERIGRFHRRSRPYRRKGLRKVQIRRMYRRIRRLTKIIEACEMGPSTGSDVGRWG